MKRWYLGVAVVVLLSGGWLGRGLIFPSEVTRVERLLNQVAAEVSFGPEEGNVAGVRRISGVMNRFAPEVAIEVELLGVGTFSLTGRDELQQALLASRRAARRLSLNFHDLIVHIDDPPHTAAVRLTATAEAEGRGRNQDGFEAIEFALQLRKIEGNWRIQKVVTVPTLKQ